MTALASRQGARGQRAAARSQRRRARVGAAVDSAAACTLDSKAAVPRGRCRVNRPRCRGARALRRCRPVGVACRGAIEMTPVRCAAAKGTLYPQRGGRQAALCGRQLSRAALAQRRYSKSEGTRCTPIDGMVTLDPEPRPRTPCLADSRPARTRANCNTSCCPSSSWFKRPAPETQYDATAWRIHSALLLLAERRSGTARSLCFHG